MEPEKLYKEIKKDLENQEKILFLGGKSLLHALYTAGRTRKERKNIKAQAIIPPDSEIRNEEKAIEKAEDKETVKNGTPDTYYRVGNLKMEKEKYPLIIDFRTSPITHLPKTMKKLQDKGKIAMKLSNNYIYPLKTTVKKFLRKKKKLKSTRKTLKDMNLNIETYKVLEDQDIFIKAQVKNFKHPYIDIEPAPLKEVSENITKEILPQAKFAREGSSFSIESEDEEFLYDIQKIKDTRKGSLELQYNFLTGEKTHKKDIKGRKGKKFKVEVKPDLPRFREEIEDSERLIIPKDRIKDYYA